MSKTIADRLRNAIKRSGISENELARLTGVSQSHINRFMHGRDMGLMRAQKIAAYLGLELREKR